VVLGNGKWNGIWIYVHMYIQHSTLMEAHDMTMTGSLAADNLCLSLLAQIKNRKCPKGTFVGDMDIGYIYHIHVYRYRIYIGLVRGRGWAQTRRSYINHSSLLHLNHAAHCPLFRIDTEQRRRS
jgi:hypothetical protein